MNWLQSDSNYFMRRCRDDLSDCSDFQYPISTLARANGMIPNYDSSEPDHIAY